jgi:hypothetical protein
MNIFDQPKFLCLQEGITTRSISEKKKQNHSNNVGFYAQIWASSHHLQQGKDVGVRQYFLAGILCSTVKEQSLP